MAFNGSGVHNRVHDWTQDLANSIPVTASRMDAEHDDISASLSNCICRDGQSSTTARIPFGAGVSAAAGSSASVAYGQTNDTNTGLYFPNVDQWGLAAGGAATLTSTSSGVLVNVALGVTGVSTFSNNVTIAGTLAVTGDVTHHGQPIVPIGAVVDFAGTTAPNGWLLCFGQAISRSTYSALFNVISTRFGAGDGSTTFNLPDLRGRVVAGHDAMGGSSANRLTGALTGGVNGDNFGAAGGAEGHQLTNAEVPASNVTVNIIDPGHAHTGTAPFSPNLGGGAGASDVRAGQSPITINTASTGITASGVVQGGGGTHNNVQPTFILNKIIYTGVYA